MYPIPAWKRSDRNGEFSLARKPPYTFIYVIDRQKDEKSGDANAGCQLDVYMIYKSEV